MRPTRRFLHAMAMGFDMFYLGSIGGDGSNCEWVGPGQIRWTADNAYSILRPLCPKATGFASRGRRSSSPRPSPRGA